MAHGIERRIKALQVAARSMAVGRAMSEDRDNGRPPSGSKAAIPQAETLPQVQPRPSASQPQAQPGAQAHVLSAIGAVADAPCALQPHRQSAPGQAMQRQEGVEEAFVMAISFRCRTRRIRAKNSVRRHPMGLERNG